MSATPHTNMSKSTYSSTSVQKQKYGTPVGVVILSNKDIHPFKEACSKALPHLKKITNRGIDPYPHDSGTRSGYKQIHVPTEVAAAIVDGNEVLMQFLQECGGKFISGVRRKKGRRRGRGCHERLELESSDAVGTTGPGNGTNNQMQKVGSQAKFTFVELFAGIGGFRIGLEKLGGACVLASERDPITCKLYRRHFNCNHNNDHLIEADMLDIVSEDFPPSGFDILTAGFPCQPFSRRGKRKGLEDANHRGQLYQELVRVLMEQQPPFFLFENVVGLVTMDGGHAARWNWDGNGKGESEGTQSREHTRSFKSGKVMDKILDAFRACGYKVEWHVVNSRHFVPQYRERVYFVGSLLELNCPDMEWENIYPSSNNDNDEDNAILIPPPVLREIMDTEYATSDAVAECELSQRQWEKLQKIYSGEATTRASLNIDDYAPTLISSYRIPSSPTTRFIMEEADGTLRHGNPLRPRYLTPKEFCRIMGFPEDFDTSPPLEAEFQFGHIYQALGNAVVPPVVEAIGKEILRLMVGRAKLKQRTCSSNKVEFNDDK